MKNNSIIIVSGEPKSVFLEIFLKALKFNKFISPIILITSLKLLKNQMKKFKIKQNINLIDKNNFNVSDLKKTSINLIDVKLNINFKSKKITNDSNLFIKNCFNIGLNLIKRNKSYKFINGPISKKTFLKKKFPGMTEYIAKSFNINNSTMLIYNKNLSVCPLTTHIPIKNITKINTIHFLQELYQFQNQN